LHKLCRGYLSRVNLYFTWLWICIYRE